MLDLVEIPLLKARLKYARLDGSLTMEKREKQLKRFREDPKVTVMLMSLKAGSLGINLVCASVVFLLDPWWNPAVEEQAINRCHRLGQHRPVRVVRFTVKDSVEVQMLSMQERKRRVANDVTESSSDDWANASADRLGLDDLKQFFASG